MFDLDAKFPSWRSIETFGPPGAGKTWLCRATAAGRPEVFTTAESEHPTVFGARSVPPPLQRLLPAELLAPLGRLLRKWRVRSEWRRPDRDIADYRRAVEAVASLPVLSSDMRRHVFKKIQHTAFLLDIARAEGIRILVDEGALRKLMTVLQRTIIAGADHDHVSKVAAVLKAYPWERNALLVTASCSTCLARQSARGQAVASEALPQESYHRAAEELLSLCGSLGWTCTATTTDTRESVPTGARNLHV